MDISRLDMTGSVVECSVQVVSALARCHQMPGVVVLSVGDERDLIWHWGGGWLIELYPGLLHLLGGLLDHLLRLLIWVAV